MTGDSFHPMNIIIFNTAVQWDIKDREWHSYTAFKRWILPPRNSVIVLDSIALQRTGEKFHGSFLWTGKSISRGNAASVDVSVGLQHFVLYSTFPDRKPEDFSSRKDFFLLGKTDWQNLPSYLGVQSYAVPLNLKSLTQHQNFFMTRIALIEKGNKVG